MSRRPQFARRHPAPSAEEINALRLAAGLTEYQMAKLLDVSASSVQAWVQGKNIMPSPIWKLANILLKRRIKPK